ncbi:MAG: alkaline phosphatase D family protein [Limnochordaceae bacterium]|nr:alkaline phosphatase D family protein [Limnochordaceae bacterium]
MSVHAGPGRQTMHRRDILRASVAGAAAILGTGFSSWGAKAAAALAGGPRPTVPYGVQAGDVTQSAATIWAAADRPARLVLEYSLSPRFTDVRRVVGPAALPETGLTAKAVLAGLPAGEPVFYRAFFEDLARPGSFSEPVSGQFLTAPADRRDIRFVWSGDTAGQGWGINPDWGGYRLYEVMRRVEPDFFVHCGDMIYADNPILPEVKRPDGSIWRNVTTPAKSRVAQALDDFRGNYQYNLLDDNLRRFNAAVAQYVMWDDHEVHNNWFPQQALGDERYSETSAALLAAWSRRAMFEFTPISVHPFDRERVYRVFRRGPLLDLFLLDMRTYRGPNSSNDQPELTETGRILGAEQARWLKEQLLRSRAVWKVIASDMPLGLVVPDGENRYEAVAQGEGGLPLGRELELADILRFIKENGIKNVVWITADVHYCATHRFDPSRAAFTDFRPFYEFVSGPIHAGGFGPNELDSTFGPEVVFSKYPPHPNAAPDEGYLFFGHVHIEGRTGKMTVSHRDLAGRILHQTELDPEA